MTAGAPSPPGARLAAVLQQLRRRTGLSLAQLANASTYSKSSWERYLNGKSLPPRSAVKELCRLADEPADHALALLDIARTERTEDSGPARGTPVRQRRAPDAGVRGAGTVTVATDSAVGETAAAHTVPAGALPTAPGPSGTDGVDTSAGHHRHVNVAAALLSACAVVLGALVLTHLPPTHREEAAPPAPSPVTGALCRHTACQDKDPIAMRCGAEPLTLAEHETASGAWVQIRYSQECGASWARMWGTVIRDRVELRVGGRHGSRHSARVTTRHEAETYVHTLMSVVGPGTPVRACFSPAGGGHEECFEAQVTDGAAVH
ncbi:transcriptional regulator with XRE-family HTH domain [Streptomyces sp. SAI-135]|uniref:helix-turn-helix domain-containing protein n=1 Tax=unclassified Streptomyces TaxID=2593676 RepID=UPI002473193F|nr:MULTISPECIES: XRE family transcriptional regulator [unclassified Streptomyces]MDH6514288.1 transcriptional regulator with XRE-family HTH domain [Streptomyces sp. SAI-090]MDH6621628.1 transcriptional regulator with XRE-family HTH domain [Streptomyces sp. SAI-135]